MRLRATNGSKSSERVERVKKKFRNKKMGVLLLILVMTRPQLILKNQMILTK